ncbi:MAG: hypothetical protein ACK5U4_11120 [Rhodospirillales bacterium]|jgi:hypothetical protein
MSTQYALRSVLHLQALHMLKLLAANREKLKLDQGPGEWLDVQIRRLEIWGDDIFISAREAELFRRISSNLEKALIPANANNSNNSAANG